MKLFAFTVAALLACPLASGAPVTPPPALTHQGDTLSVQADGAAPDYIAPLPDFLSPGMYTPPSADTYLASLDGVAAPWASPPAARHRPPANGAARRLDGPRVAASDYSAAQPVPEPSFITMLLIGLCLLVFTTRAEVTEKFAPAPS
ncbi:PEP-CTERM sorting domain-containing protein [Janthinobacterium fluminis]|uniref:PEP-CTERM protein-sorting domain-containing protein n=1 Tax=Janthinobacterium fluminis TaxID=2987524 RepID=A0ABT5K1I8_9BURK|nr:PEP-CTERM sorting domain-containing protein [Janthinobacterium fluminis]MDC8758794.1 hypothetical protein [Janthinobacterium fluminis]